MSALPFPVAATALLMLALPGSAQRRLVDNPLPPGGVTTVRTEMRIQRVIIRVPRAPIAPASFSTPRPLPPIQWVEKRADRCVPVQDLAAVTVSRPDSVDLLLAGGKRLRARLADDCAALDFYAGLYFKPSGDGQMCAARDVLRSRSGGQCRIAQFRTLVPAR
ncbi:MULTISPECIES: hypothetical protein [unclassified Sphingomonas]|uniref:hypothetical protein n=1 Tax=unclassified Sphingomonas TaxID=196159 RepID=UPI0006FD7516|nr:MULTISPECIES: hypothetical protein [unclassified Sphingomonas]KQN07284.1 hypothetical protein ASE78_13830 [Sphingomonas sp. Leaf25]KQN34202.1 hypothetical protein ASE97_16150 [Sphingomonas sp. Leaf42]KQT30645.1 hypothetical protein ASG37_06215 [Sphingomonas sp. Leaf407]